MTYTLELHEITKSYGETAVLEALDLLVPTGSVFALLGPNGAGKTTVVRILATLLNADAGSARVAGYDVVADGSDNFATRYLVADACYFARKPLVTAALGTFDGTLTTIRAYERGADGKPNPTYRCLFPEAPPPGTVPACAEAGVLGALAGVLGSLMALEVIREIVGGFGDGGMVLGSGASRSTSHPRGAESRSPCRSPRQTTIPRATIVRSSGS